MLLPWEKVSVSRQEDTKSIEMEPKEKVKKPLTAFFVFLSSSIFILASAFPHTMSFGGRLNAASQEYYVLRQNYSLAAWKEEGTTKTEGAHRAERTARRPLWSRQ